MLGAKTGGRQKGTKNKRTVQKHMQRERGFDPERLLPKEVLEEVMTSFYSRAQMYERQIAAIPGDKVEPELVNEYERWSKNAAEVARMYAPYCHPTYKAILIPDQHVKSGLLTDFYLNIFERRRAPAQIEAKPVNGNGKAE